MDSLDFVLLVHIKDKTTGALGPQIEFLRLKVKEFTGTEIMKTFNKVDGVGKTLSGLLATNGILCTMTVSAQSPSKE